MCVYALIACFYLCVCACTWPPFIFVAYFQSLFFLFISLSFGCFFDLLLSILVDCSCELLLLIRVIAWLVGCCFVLSVFIYISCICSLTARYVCSFVQGSPFEAETTKQNKTSNRMMVTTDRCIKWMYSWVSACVCVLYASGFSTSPFPFDFLHILFLSHMRYLNDRFQVVGAIFVALFKFLSYVSPPDT